MKNSGHEVSALFKPLAVFLRDLEILLDQSHRGDASETNDDLGTDDSDLLAQVFDAGVFFLGQRIAVFGRTAFENVGDLNL